MNERNEQLVLTVESIIKQALEVFESQQDVNFLSDLHLFFDEENANLTVYDDVENKLIEGDLDSFVEFLGQSKVEKIIEAGMEAVNKLNQRGFFDKEYVLKPFSVNFVDADFIVSEELIFIDNELMKLNDPLLADLDQELNDFLKELMK